MIAVTGPGSHLGGESVITTVGRVFWQYALRHVVVPLPPLDLPDVSGRAIGRIERLELRAGRLQAVGWALGRRVGFAGPEAEALAPPTIERPDVAAAFSLAPAAARFGFETALADWAHGAHFVVETDSGRHIYRIPPTYRWQLRRAMLARVPGFLVTCLSALPDAARWSLNGYAGVRQRIKARLVQPPDPRPTGPDLPAALLDAPGLPRAPATTRITIVLPVYNAFDLLPETLARVVENTDLDWHLVAVEDGSTDPAVRPWLRDWAATQGSARVTLIENARNLGFIGSVNRALAVALARGDHVVLLNSDAFVPPGWAGRLLAPILSLDRVASVTPMSNDAEIFSAPVICRAAALPDRAADRLDAVAARLGGPALLSEVPTGVGFCMAMNIAALAEGPTLDPAFGRGYGEEVDWCRRRLAADWRHIGHGGIFVEHRGGQSFGSATKQRLIRDNNARIARRYPGYDAEVQRFIAADPVRGPRLALALAWAGIEAAARGAPVPVYLGHSLGGGAALWLSCRIAQDLVRVGAAVELRVGGPRRWRLIVHTAHGRTEGATCDTAQMADLIDLLGARRIVYSCGVGDPDPVALPGILRALAQGGAHPVEVLIHDFFPLSPSYTLLDADGRFRGVPARTCTDPAHRFHRPNGAVIGLPEWRAAWRGLLDAADRVQVFSDDSRSHVLAAYPALLGRVQVTPHHPIHRVPAIAPTPRREGPPTLGVLGNIGQAKGARLVQVAARQLAATGAARIVVIGNIDPAFPLARPSLAHGAYDPADLAALVARYGIAAWWVPSVWPETFSFTTHEALATRLPVCTFDLGAQGQAVRAAVRSGAAGGVVPLSGDERVDAALALDLLTKSVNVSAS